MWIRFHLWITSVIETYGLDTICGSSLFVKIWIGFHFQCSVYISMHLSIRFKASMYGLFYTSKELLYLYGLGWRRRED